MKKTNKYWTESEINQLKIYIKDKISVTEMAQKLNRPYSSVMNKTSRVVRDMDIDSQSTEAWMNRDKWKRGGELEQESRQIAEWPENLNFGPASDPGDDKGAFTLSRPTNSSCGSAAQMCAETSGAGIG
jgi:hypothetical protein